MGTFVALTASPDILQNEHLYKRAIEAGKLNAAAKDGDVAFVRTSWSCAASFPRRNQAGSQIASDIASESWLSIVGTCFHEAGNQTPEFLLQQFLAHGADQLACSLEGFFAVIAGNGRTKEITVITDIIGSCHFFSRRVGEVTALSSSSSVLSSLAEVSLDPVACQEFLATGIMYEDRTLHREIKKLPPASIITFRDGEEVVRRLYWDVSSLSPESLAPEAATDALWHALVSAAAKIGNRFERVVCDLTGGYDSRAMVGAFLGAKKSFVSVVSGPEDSRDVIVSRCLAGKLGLEHLHNIGARSFSPADLIDAALLTDAEYDIVEYAGIANIHRELSRRFDISINGSFGELARGYWWELLVPHAGARRKLDSHNLARRRYAYTSSSDLFRPELRFDLAEHMAKVIDRATADVSAFPNTFQMDVAYLRMRMHRWQGRIASSTNKLWPCLSPFMFRSVVETMLQATSAVRKRSLLVRKMLARYVPAVAEFPLEHGYPAMPATPLNSWRFWPICPYYAGKVAQKAHFFRRQPSTGGDRVRIESWSSSEISSLLCGSEMKSASILDPSALATFLKASQEPAFARNSEWNRLLSVEMACAAAEACSTAH